MQDGNINDILSIRGNGKKVKKKEESGIAVCFDAAVLLPLPLLSVARITNDDDGVIRNSRGRLVRGNIEPSTVENSQRGLRDNGVELRGYNRP
uniref:Uncharacterized protein n=1 Tax=Wuchereria bancrofti TaxID=6293 RepID=A0AAF5PU94_WUCBA